jgi:hypothetical protein
VSLFAELQDAERLLDEKDKGDGKLDGARNELLAIRNKLSHVRPGGSAESDESVEAMREQVAAVVKKLKKPRRRAKKSG